MINKISSKRNRLIVTMLVCTSLLSACTTQGSAKVENLSQVSNTSSLETSSTKSEVSVVYDSDDLDSTWTQSEATNIVLSDKSITTDGAVVIGNKVTISSAGTYSISGTLRDGQIIVNTEDKGIVRLILNGADITCSNSAPIYIMSAKKTVIVLAEGTENQITDGDSYILEDVESEEPDAAIFSKGDLTINGNGSLIVNANYKNAITSKDELKIASGQITVNAANDGIRGKDFLSIKNGNITVNAKGDGLKSNNDEDAQKGFVFIEGGTINITAGEDAIQAETNVLISDGNITISSGGGSSNGIKKAAERPGMKRDSLEHSSDTSVSTKGIKATSDITIDGGSITIDSADDSIHSNDSVAINNGTITASSGDDGIHADSTLLINGGTINITKSYEGIESGVITINDVDIHIVSSDDGINVSSSDDDSIANGPPGQKASNTSSTSYLYINGGYIVVDAGGDGLDSNGSIKMTEGTVLVNGPTNNGNGALDYDGSFAMTGGYIATAGSSGMAQATDTSGTQNSVMVNFESTLPGGTLVHIETQDGAEVLTFAPTKDYQSVFLCSPKLKSGSTYVVYSGGRSTGTSKDGLYSEGTYTSGIKYQSFTISETLTKVGTFNNDNMRGGKRR